MEKVQWNSINKNQNRLKQYKNEKLSTPPPQTSWFEVSKIIQNIMKRLLPWSIIDYYPEA